jgi:CheY-like chemotaxis protein
MAQHRILLVEDTDDVGDAMADLLEGEGYPVTRARDGVEALALLRRNLDPCLIVLDLFMPGMSGVEFRRIQRADPTIADVPVIVVSGVANMVTEMAAMGILRCFRKPVDFGELLGVVTELCPAA